MMCWSRLFMTWLARALVWKVGFCLLAPAQAILMRCPSKEPEKVPKRRSRKSKLRRLIDFRYGVGRFQRNYTIPLHIFCPELPLHLRFHEYPQASRVDVACCSSQPQR